MLLNKPMLIAMFIVLTACSNSHEANHTAKHTQIDTQMPSSMNVESPTKPEIQVTMFEGMVDDDGNIAGLGANLIGKLVVVDHCLLIQSGSPEQPTYDQPAFSKMSYAWDKEKSVLINKHTNQEYPIGSEISIGGGNANDEFQKIFNIPKCSIDVPLWIAS